MKYSLKEIRKKQSLAEKYHLEGRELLKDCDAIQKYCNGIGASITGFDDHRFRFTGQ